MKKLITIIFIPLFIQLNGQSNNSVELKNALIELKNDNNISNQQKYFELFPNSFTELLNMFGFENGKGAPLYDGSEYIQAFFQLDSISEAKYMKKWVDISINGHWDTDAVSHFQFHLRLLVLEKTNLTYQVLKKYTHKEIESFFYFFFNEIHPQYESIPSQFEKFKNLDRDFYDIILTGLKKAIKDSGH